MTSRKPRKKRSKTPNPLRMYFHAGTQAAIVDYQNCQDTEERNRIYTKDIEPAFTKLVENLLNIHKFSSMYDSFDDLKNDCVSFLFDTLMKYDVSRGTAAFSYYNVVSKNYLIIKTKKKAQMTKRSVSLDDPESMSSNDSSMIEDQCIVPSQEVLLENAMVANNIIDVLYEVRSKVKSENELVCVNSIITVFESIDQLDLCNKSAVMLYLRELSGLTSKQLTTALQSVKRQYKKLKGDNDAEFFF